MCFLFLGGDRLFTSPRGLAELTKDGPANSMLEPCLNETLLFNVEPKDLFLEFQDKINVTLKITRAVVGVKWSVCWH